APAPADRRALWARPRGAGGWSFEFLLSDRHGGDWVFPRDPRVRRPLWSLGRATDDGIPFLAPEVVLLFKAKRREPRDEADLAATLPLLPAGERRWLRDALEVAHPGHPWIGRIEAPPGEARLASWETRALRQRLLRPHARVEDLALPHEDRPGSAHFGVFADGEVVATASVMHLPAPEPGFSEWRLRAVATDPAHRGRGHAERLVRACLAHAKARGARLVWWNAAREVAPWYEAMGARRRFESVRASDGRIDVRMSVEV
ncbi:MAG TPA: GNAT family N-acetyltransferase, partial [Candidatus Thermoplasmatota archaeon]|nr:GNAT family N-acetyltransferase [Candidatus Thermoplasmatota archaeon]